MNIADFDMMLDFFKALSDESRLKIVGALAHEERTVEELASLLELRAPTVSHHLAKLKQTGLVSMKLEGNTHIYRLETRTIRDRSRQLLAVEKIDVEEKIDFDAWQRKILNDFLDGQRLKDIPASRKKRHVILQWLAGQFKPSKQYPEKKVNKIIGRHHEDFATLRRELVGAKLMQRDRGVYWRTPQD